MSLGLKVIALPQIIGNSRAIAESSGCECGECRECLRLELRSTALKSTALKSTALKSTASKSAATIGYSILRRVILNEKDAVVHHPVDGTHLGIR